MRAAVVGVSAGAPYALACGARLPGQVERVAAVSSTAPGGAPHAQALMARRYRLALRRLELHPDLARSLGDSLCGRAARRPRLIARGLALGGRGAGSEDGDDALETATRSLLAATSGGVGGMIDDYLVACRPWGFAPEAIIAPVALWHGARDRVAPPSGARELARRIPGAQLRVEETESHFFFRRRMAEVLLPLLPERPRALRPIAAPAKARPATPTPALAA